MIDSIVPNGHEGYKNHVILNRGSATRAAYSVQFNYEDGSCREFDGSKWTLVLHSVAYERENEPNLFRN